MEHSSTLLNVAADAAIISNLNAKSDSSTITNIMSNNEDRSLSNSSSENSKRSSCVSHKSTKLVSVKNHRNSETSVNGKENENSIIYSQKMLGKTNQSNLKGTDENSFDEDREHFQKDKNLLVISSSSSNSTSSTSSAISSTSSFISTNTTTLAANTNKTGIDLIDSNSQIVAEGSARSESTTLSPKQSNKFTNIVSLETINNSNDSVNEQFQMSVIVPSVNGGEENKRLSTITCSDSPDLEIFKRNQFGGSFKDANYKQQKENYLVEKKKMTNDILTIMSDERIILLADWLKIRGSFKNWIKLYCILKPGIMQLFKSDKLKPGQWVGTIILNSLQLIKRPSKKHGFCFKLFHPLERSIWASKGPAGETYITLPYMLLPAFYLIFRAPSEKIGNIWMEAIELALKSSHLVNKSSMNSRISSATLSNITSANWITTHGSNNDNNGSRNINELLNDSFKSNRSDTFNSIKSSDSCTSNSNMKHHGGGCDGTHGSHSTNKETHNQPVGDDQLVLTESEDNKNSSGDGGEDGCSLSSSIANNIMLTNENLDEYDEDFFDEKNERNAIETKYCASAKEEFGGEKQTEEVGDETKTLILCLVKQVRPGMDLSKVVLPTFILEPRSFLEKLSDYYYHSDILTECVNCDDPYERMKLVVKFYLSGFYKKPKGLKKPYNPVLGEVFRTYWLNPKTGSKTFYIAEQVSHHPPITSFYVTNRQDGFCIYGTILARSKFYGNSMSAIMEGGVKIILLNRGEEYTVTLPYANCKGILIGKMTMELGGKVKIDCAKTGFSSDIEFRLKPLLSSSEASNQIQGKIRFGNKEAMAIVSGKWDGEIVIQEKANDETRPFWCPSREMIEKRLKRFVVAFSEQQEFESEKLWFKVSEAIRACDQYLATEEKTKIESRQRQELGRSGAGELCAATKPSTLIDTICKRKYFTFDNLNKEWIYNFSDLRPWDPQTDMFQYESEFKILTKTKHNLKVASRINNDHRTSLLSIQQHHGIVTNVNVSESNESENESYDLLEQYNHIKHRLDLIEGGLKKLNVKFESSTKLIEKVALQIADTGRLTTSSAQQSKIYPSNAAETNYSRKNFVLLLILSFFIAVFSSIVLKYFFN